MLCSTFKRLCYVLHRFSKQLYSMSCNRVYNNLYMLHTTFLHNRFLSSYITFYIQRYILVVNCICNLKMLYCYITFSLTWYVTCYICCIACYVTKVVRNIKCMLFNISQPSRWIFTVTVTRCVTGTVTRARPPTQAGGVAPNSEPGTPPPPLNSPGLAEARRGAEPRLAPRA